MISANTQSGTANLTIITILVFEDAEDKNQFSMNLMLFRPKLVDYPHFKRDNSSIEPQMDFIVMLDELKHYFDNKFKKFPANRIINITLQSHLSAFK